MNIINMTPAADNPTKLYTMRISCSFGKTATTKSKLKKPTKPQFNAPIKTKGINRYFFSSFIFLSFVMLQYNYTRLLIIYRQDIILNAKMGSFSIYIYPWHLCMPD